MAEEVAVLSCMVWHPSPSRTRDDPLGVGQNDTMPTGGGPTPRHASLGLIFLLLLVGISYQVGNYVLTGIAAIAAVLVLIIEGWRFRNERREKRKRDKMAQVRAKQLEELFSVDYEDRSAAKMLPSDRSQHLAITLTMALETYVEFVVLGFEGGSSAPRIKSLYDWQYGCGRQMHDVSIDALLDGRWYWRYHPPFRRAEGARITIGIECRANEEFSGHLCVHVATLDGVKDRALPVEVHGEE